MTFGMNEEREILELKQKIENLENEIQELREWKVMRLKIDEESLEHAKSLDAQRVLILEQIEKHKIENITDENEMLKKEIQELRDRNAFLQDEIDNLNYEIKMIARENYQCGYADGCQDGGRDER